MTLPLVARFINDDYIDFSWDISIVITVLMGSSIAILNSSLMGLAGMLPSKFMNALMLGISLNGILILFVRVPTLFIFDISNTNSYF